jgi:hypothetical protein
VRAGGLAPISTAVQGGAAILRLVEGDDVAAKSGLFFSGTNEARADPQAYDMEARLCLRELSLKLTGPRSPALSRRR